MHAFHPLLLGLFFILSCLNCGRLAAQDKIAFVLGNAEYENQGSTEHDQQGSTEHNLPSAAADARSFARMLKDRGFEFPLADEDSGATLNKSRAGILDCVKKLRAIPIRKCDTVFFYYAGHGGQVDSDVYILGTDARIDKDHAGEDLKSDGVSLELFARILRPATGTGTGLFMVFDACRIGNASDYVRDYGDNTVVAFSTAARKAAANGRDGGSSAFTKALVLGLAKGETVRKSMEEANEAAKRTGQQPNVYSNQNCRIYELTLFPSNNPPSSANKRAYTEPLYLTHEVKTDLSLRVNPGGESVGELRVRQSGGIVAMCDSGSIKAVGNATYVPIKFNGWIACEKTGAKGEYITRRSKEFEVKSSSVEVRIKPSVSQRGYYALKRGAKGVLLGSQAVEDGFRWVEIEWEGWVTCKAASGKQYVKIGAAELTRKSNSSTAPNLQIPASRGISEMVGKEQSFLPKGIYKGTITFIYPKNVKLISIRTLQIGESQTVIKMYSSDQFNTANSRVYKSEIDIRGRMERGDFVSSSQDVRTTEYERWIAEKMQLRLLPDRDAIWYTASFIENNKEIVGTGKLVRAR